MIAFLVVAVAVIALEPDDGGVRRRALSGVARASVALRRPVVRRALDWITGVVLVAFGVRLVTERR